MKLSKILAGTRAIHRVALPLVNTPAPFLAEIPELAEQRARDAAAQPGQAPPGVPAPEVGLRVLTGEEASTVYEKAWTYAKAHGSAKPDEADPVYALALSVYTLAVACVDADSDPARPELFFAPDGSPFDVEAAAEAIRTTPHLGRDGIAYLCEAQETWQDVCHPQAKNLSGDQFWSTVLEVATSPDAGPFSRMRRGLLLSCMRSMAVLLAISREPRSPSGSSSGTDSTSDTSAETEA